MVEDNQYLRTLNLASLRQVVDGGIRIANNPQLCLVDTISFDDYLVNSRLYRVGPASSDCSGELASEALYKDLGTRCTHLPSPASDDCSHGTMYSTQMFPSCELISA